MLILLDQYGVLANFEQGFYNKWQSRMGDEVPPVPLMERKSFYLRDDYQKELLPVVEDIYTAPGFFRDLPPIEGALQAVQRLLELGHDVRICTSPLNQYRNCVAEKYEWVEKHLGFDFTHRIIVTKDKTVVNGDVLIDDKPVVTGVQQPKWKHIIFDQPYNRHIDAPRLDWSSWQDKIFSHIA